MSLRNDRKLVFTNSDPPTFQVFFQRINCSERGFTKRYKKITKRKTTKQIILGTTYVKSVDTYF